MSQSMKLGASKLREAASNPLAGLKPFTEEECWQCWQTPDPEFDALEAAMTERAYHPLKPI